MNNGIIRMHVHSVLKYECLVIHVCHVLTDMPFVDSVDPDHPNMTATLSAFM